MPEPAHDAKVIGMILRCEHCHKEFKYVFERPIAVKCTECNSTFDARLQLVKNAREDFEQITGKY